jgi:hypothetical protein
VDHLDPLQMLCDRGDHHIREGHHPILATLAVADQDRAMIKIQVLHAQSNRLHEPQSPSEEQASDQPVTPLQMPQR